MNAVIQCAISVDGRPCALLTITNARTGTEAAPDYRVTLDAFRERRTVHARIEHFDITDCRRLELIAEAFRILGVVERMEAAHVTTT